MGVGRMIAAVLAVVWALVLGLVVLALHQLWVVHKVNRAAKKRPIPPAVTD